MARARENNVTSIAFPALGTGVGGYPLDEAAQITLAAVRAELARSPSIEVVTFALRGAAAYAAFQAAIQAVAPNDAVGLEAGQRSMMLPPDRTEEQRDELVDRVAREIHLRGLAAPAVHFLNASRPYRPLGSNAMLFFDPILHGLFGGEVSSATELLADDIGIEQLIERLEEWDEDDTLDA